LGEAAVRSTWSNGWATSALYGSLLLTLLIQLHLILRRAASLELRGGGSIVGKAH
jgi:hypothetical protein